MKIRERAPNFPEASFSFLFCSKVCSSHLQFQYFAGNYSYPFATWGMSCKALLSCIFCLVSATPAVCDLQRRGLGRVAARWAVGARAWAHTQHSQEVGCSHAQAAWAAWLSTGWRNYLRVLVFRRAWLPSARHKTWSNLCFQKWRCACSPHTLSVFTGAAESLHLTKF